MLEGKEITVTRGAVSTESPTAARIGAAILEGGGNAMDAAAATCLATAVLLPYYVDLGGYVSSATVLDGKSGEVWCLDSSSIAPAAAHATMFPVIPPEPGKTGINENEYECSVRDDANIFGPLAVSIPGFMAGTGMLWEKWGRLKWHQIVAPSQDLLANGFPYGDVAPAIEKRISIIRRFEPTFKLLLPNGKLPAPQDTWHRPGLEKTLNRLAATGWQDFYDGDIGRRVADCIGQIGGVLTRADMAGFTPRFTQPLRSTFRDATIFGSTPPSGALSTIEILNMLDCFEPLPLEEPRYWHRLAEILKLAWRDRLRYVADPDFSDVPVEMLLSKRYAAGRVETMRHFPDYVDRLGLPPASAIRHGTAHVSAADAEGNLVAVTISQGNPFGSCVTVPETGFILAHGMCRFDPRPGRTNSIEPGKRPLSNVAPLIIRTPDRDIALGMRGGRRIVSACAQIAQRLVDFKMTSHQAADAPRIHTLADEPVEYEKSGSFRFANELTLMGHSIREVDELGGTAHCTELFRTTGMIRSGGTVGAAGI